MSETNTASRDLVAPALMDLYRAIEDSSSKMLEAAKSQDWNSVVQHEGTCAVLIEQLRYSAKRKQLAAEHRREKARIMQRILHNDAQIRILAEPWLAQFDHLAVNGQPQFIH
ncbi:MAG: flagellar protein FliT [Comamonas sp.]|nr:flagellar protein FliT [Comamonas sp.]